MNLQKMKNSTFHSLKYQRGPTLVDNLLVSHLLIIQELSVQNN